MISFLCPVCRQPLTLKQSVYECEKRRSVMICRVFVTSI